MSGEARVKSMVMAFGAMGMLVCFAVEAQVDDGSRLLRSLEASQLLNRTPSAIDRLESAYGVGYITGAVDSARWNGSACIPVLPPIYLMDIVYTYLTRHRDRLHLPAAALVADAFTDRFPC
jgi:hypothetical protein